MVGRNISRRPDYTNWWPELLPSRMFDWIDWPGLNTMRETEHMLRVEEYVENDMLVVRAELPGIDPDKDVHVQLRDHTLEIRAERREEQKSEEKGVRRSEFRYGSFFRTISMPESAKESDVDASYADGILEIRVPLEPKHGAEPKAIPVARK
jgi:HSP20 family protein